MFCEIDSFVVLCEKQPSDEGTKINLLFNGKINLLCIEESEGRMYSSYLPPFCYFEVFE